ncbi:MTRF1L release factor glutamine methyltransferase-like isoform X2 [Mercenaria mercenaria]|uniref:MTRF1L release factor glutamine methyltransferase-like isoform X2 n=1 Tax=Mercenaria mercenaria TaxID=6596 RepID=UPI00234F4465|nr:MTRF1L release factor glutamine methyltransferase-like isoform X2 [Mercenaria mercenaria]XP_045166004.2 MTRF1L release factor glutamine methyltransferase-like isoform X2 [Mercenaria mercenaria]
MCTDGVQQTDCAGSTCTQLHVEDTVLPFPLRKVTEASALVHEVDMKTVLSEQILRSIDEMCSERLKRVPVQYIIGEWDFHDMTLEMRQPVLIPRPETEELASIIVDEWPLEREQEGTFLEIGCGTGALSLYILSKLPNVQCIAVDKSETACTLTLTNASRFNLQDRIQVIHGDIFKDQTISELSCNGPYNVLVSNPPYLTSDEMDTLEKEVAGYEDHGALHGGTDGLDIICRILAESCNLIKDKQSVLWLEVGLEQPEKIKKIVELHPEFMLSYIKTIQDFTQRGRFCKLQLKK